MPLPSLSHHKAEASSWLARISLGLTLAQLSERLRCAECGGPLNSVKPWRIDNVLSKPLGAAGEFHKTFGAEFSCGCSVDSVRNLPGRYTLERGSDLSVWRLDQLTGETRLCIATAWARTVFQQIARSFAVRAREN